MQGIQSVMSSYETNFAFFLYHNAPNNDYFLCFWFHYRNFQYIDDGDLAWDADTMSVTQNTGLWVP